MNKYITLFLALVVVLGVTSSAQAYHTIVDTADVPFICSEVNVAFLIADAHQDNEESLLREKNKAIADKTCYALAYNVTVVLDYLVMDYVDYEGGTTELWKIKSTDDWYVFTYPEFSEETGVDI